MPTTIYTIGHSNHGWEEFATLLTDNDVELLVDVRSNPVSRFAPFASYRNLPGLLERVGIDYELLGGILGGKPENPDMYHQDGKPNYRAMRSADLFQEAIDQLVSMATRRTTAVLCSEEDPAHCHRVLLLGPALEEGRGCSLLHIRGDGAVQQTGQLDLGKRYGEQLQGTLPL